MVQKSAGSPVDYSQFNSLFTRGFLHPKRWVGLGHPADTILPGERAAHPAPTLVMKVRGAKGSYVEHGRALPGNYCNTSPTSGMFEDDVFLSWRVNFTQVLLRSFGYLWWVYSLYKWCTCQNSAWNVPSFVDLAGRKLQCRILM